MCQLVNLNADNDTLNLNSQCEDETRREIHREITITKRGKRIFFLELTIFVHNLYKVIEANGFIDVNAYVYVLIMKNTISFFATGIIFLLVSCSSGQDNAGE